MTPLGAALGDALGDAVVGTAVVGATVTVQLGDVDGTPPPHAQHADSKSV